MERISKHISYEEGVHSNTALRLDIINTPGAYEISNMAGIAHNLFEPLRLYVGGAIKISSFYRSPDLNTAIGGSSKSQHCQGRAIDIDDTFGYLTNAEMFEHIKSVLNFDQLIWEFGDDKNPNWVHMSYISSGENRGRVMRAYKDNGRTSYKMI